MNMVETASVTTMALTTPNLFASQGAASVDTPTTMLETPSIGPLNESGMPYWAFIQAVIKGTTMPAPKAIIAPVKTYFAKTFFDFLGSSSLKDAFAFLDFDSLTFKIINVEDRLSAARTT